MQGSALEEAHALSVTTRKRMRSMPIEDPISEIERILEYVRTHSYGEAYAFLRSPPNLEVPHRLKGESGAGYMLGALLMAPIWVLAAPLFLAGVATNLVAPSSDERRNRHYRLGLIEYLESLRGRVEREVAADANYAQKVSAQLRTFGLQGYEKLATPSVEKEWDSYLVVRAGRVQKRSNGWHLVQMGHLHVGDVNACLFGDDGSVIELPTRGVTSVTAVRRCLVIMTFSRPKGKQVGLFLPTRALEVVAHLSNLAVRVAEQSQPRRSLPKPQMAIEAVTRGTLAVKQLASRKKT